MKYLKISLGIFFALAASRFIPHPPNFTNLIALSFYVPAFLGTRYIPAVLLAFMITDVFIGFHNTMFYTSLSVLFIGFVSKYFCQNIKFRAAGLFLSAIMFFIITNFGVWLTGSYGFTPEGLILCYTMAIPFFFATFLSTFLYGFLIESIFKLAVKYQIIKI